MKKTVLLACAVFVFSSTFAAQVDEQTARQVARNFVTFYSEATQIKGHLELELVYSSLSSGQTFLGSQPQKVLFYVYNFDSRGFVIVAGDDAVRPILGYSDEEAYDPEQLPPSVEKWLEDYKEQIRYAIGNELHATPETEREWEQYADATGNPVLKLSRGVNPLVQTTWNQSPYYNDLCPGGSVSGCVATAMAQVMKYWDYPVTGSGFHSYNHSVYGTLSANFGNTTYAWASMPNAVNGPNNAVATLMYHCGVGCDMDYSPNSSGAYVIMEASPVQHCAEYALRNYFGYKTSMLGVQRVNYSDTEWTNLLKADLDAGRPILYAGFGSGGGHCFVFDGYDNNGYFHVNWGWGGAYDGYFLVDNLNPDGTGTGGGTGGYYSGHQALTGIESPEGGGGGGGGSADNYELALYDYLNASSYSITYGDAFSVTTAIGNYDTRNFNGDFCAAVFDSDLAFVDFVEILQGFTLNSGYYTDVTFNNSGLVSMLPGTYYISTYYRPTDGNWMLVLDNDSYFYTNLISVEVTYSNDIELYSAMTVWPGTTLTQGQPASVNLDILNNGFNTFTGTYQVDLYGMDGYWVETFGTISENEGLPPGYHYASPYLTFITIEITSPPGTYFLAVTHQWSGYDWELTGSSFHQNPVYVTIQADAIDPDMYENNNEVVQSYVLPVSFSGNTALQNTNGSNLHIGTDLDYYSISLPSGFSYIIDARIHDFYNSGNGNTYTVDALFSYSFNGIKWSDAYDDVLPGQIVVNGGGTVYYAVAPYFAGETGTYLLDMSITRVASGGIGDPDPTDAIRIYPNPADDVVSIDLTELKKAPERIGLFNALGQQVITIDHPEPNNLLTLSVHTLPEGMYLVKFDFSEGVLSKKILISR
jgi:hypothetical protein